MSKYRVLFADLDGTLIDTITRCTFPQGIWDMKIKLDVLDKIKELNPEFILIVSNQGGIENGFVDERAFCKKMDYIIYSIREYCGIENVFGMHCASNNRLDKYRKPNIGMLEHLLSMYAGDDFEYIKTVSLMIGDASGKEGQFSDSDIQTAKNFKCDYLDVEDFLSTQF